MLEIVEAADGVYRGEFLDGGNLRAGVGTAQLEQSDGFVQRFFHLGIRFFFLTRLEQGNVFLLPGIAELENRRAASVRVCIRKREQIQRLLDGAAQFHVGFGGGQVSARKFQVLALVVFQKLAINDANGAGFAVGIGLILEQNGDFGVIRFDNVNAVAGPCGEHVVDEFGTGIGKLDEIGLLFGAFA